MFIMGDREEKQTGQKQHVHDTVDNDYQHSEMVPVILPSSSQRQHNKDLKGKKILGNFYCPQFWTFQFTQYLIKWYKNLTTESIVKVWKRGNQGHTKSQSMKG